MNRIKLPLSVIAILSALPAASFAVQTVEKCTELANFNSPDYQGGPISDGEGIGFSIGQDFTGVSGNIVDLDVRVVVSDHPYSGDLVVTLNHNGGAPVTLIDRPTHPSVQFGCQSQSSSGGFDLWLDDEAGAPIENQCADTITGTYSPNEALSGFDGEAVGGSWMMTVNDVEAGEDGTFVGWCLKATVDDGVPPVVDGDFHPIGNPDGDVDFDDLGVFEQWFIAKDSRGDLDSDGDVDFDDLGVFEKYWFAANP